MFTAVTTTDCVLKAVWDTLIGLPFTSERLMHPASLHTDHENSSTIVVGNGDAYIWVEATPDLCIIVDMGTNSEQSISASEPDAIEQCMAILREESLV